MSPEPLLRWLVDGTVAVTVAIAVVLVLRIPLRHAFGARVAYAAWALVPLALAVAALPAVVQPAAALGRRTLPPRPGAGL